MSPEFWPSVVQILGYAIAAAWCVRTTEAMRGLGGVEDLTDLKWERAAPEGEPGLVVVVPARDEEANIAQTLDALMRQEYKALFVAAVDDRSDDETGEIMDGFARKFADRVGVLHVKQLPEGWLGKTHAMQKAVEATESEWVLFTDADVLFSPSSLRRALAYAVREQADHLVVMPTMQVRTWGEGVVLGFFQTFGLWVTRPWKVADARATRDAIGVGAFNLVRRAALEEIGGLEPQRMTVLEDITLGRRMKLAGKRQRVAFAPGLVLVHWAEGAKGLVRVMSKNLFSAFNFRAGLALLAGMWVVLTYVAPVAMLGWKPTLLPGLTVGVCVVVVYRLYSQWSWIPAKFAWTLPVGAAVFCWAMVRSVAVVWRDGGVKWRGTVYKTGELRKWNSPFRWKQG